MKLIIGILIDKIFGVILKVITSIIESYKLRQARKKELDEIKKIKDPIARSNALNTFLGRRS